MSEAPPLLMPVAVATAVGGTPAVLRDSAEPEQPKGDFEQLLHGLVGVPAPIQVVPQTAAFPGWAGPAGLAADPGAAPLDPLAAKSAGDPAAPAATEGSAPAAGGRRISELEFLFQRHAGKQVVEVKSQSNQPVEPVLESVARSDNPRLASIMAMLLKDGEPPAGFQPVRTAADLSTTSFFANSRPRLSWLGARPPTPSGPQTPEAGLPRRLPIPTVSGTLQQPQVAVATPEPEAGGQMPQMPAAAAPVAPGLLADKRLLAASGGSSTLPAAGSASGANGGLISGILLPQAAPLTASPPTTNALPLPAATMQVAEQLVWMAQSGQNTARIRLHPEEMGIVNVRITMEGGNARIMIDATNADMVQELTSAAPRLRNLLAHEGLGLHSLDIDQRHAGLTGGERGKQDDWTAGQRPDPYHQPTEDHDDNEALVAGELMQLQPSSLRLLDLFA